MAVPEAEAIAGHLAAADAIRAGRRSVELMPITREGLRADPVWALLQEPPRFKKLIAEITEPAE